MNVRKPDPDKMRAMRAVLKAAFDAVLGEEIPAHIHARLNQLDRNESQSSQVVR